MLSCASPVLTDLLLYCRDAKFCSAGDLCVQSTAYSLGPCTSSRFQCFGHNGCIHRQCPIGLGFEMSLRKFREVDFKEESTIFGYILRGDFREFIDKLKYLVCLFIAEESICFVMERDVPEDPLQVCELEYPGDKLPCSIFSVEIAT